MTLCIVGFDDLVTSFVATIAAGWSDPCRVGLPPTERPRLYAAHAEIPLIALSEIVEPLLITGAPSFRSKLPSNIAMSFCLLPTNERFASASHDWTRYRVCS